MASKKDDINLFDEDNKKDVYPKKDELKIKEKNIISFQEDNNCPDFYSLLDNPLIDIPQPLDFNKKEEAENLKILWKNNLGLQKYEYLAFVHAGGSGMVFKCILKTSPVPRALKIARKKLFKLKDSDSNIAKNLSPVSQHELNALQKIQHPNVVQLFESIENKNGIIGISTTYIDKPQPIDYYLNQILQKRPSKRQLEDGFNIFSPERLDDACKFIMEKCISIAQALKYMHELNMFHFDVKPANILIASHSSDKKAHLTDLGSCIDIEDFNKKIYRRVHFKWTYAHQDLTDLVNNPASITGGGLKATADVNISTNLPLYDLFSFGRTIQELLGIIEYNFGERCFTNYTFRYLHIVSALLLDGHISVIKEKVNLKDGKRFIRDIAMDYPESFFKKMKIETASDLVETLQRYGNNFSWNDQIPELAQWQSNTINTGLSIATPYTKRISKVMCHPCVRRLKSELQLGWMKEIYPGATHTRWAHTIGVFSATVSFYSALLSDPEIPTYKIVIKPKDVEHGLLASLLHDIGQSAFAHDFEAATPTLYNHKDIIERLLDDKSWGNPTLRETIKKYWPDIDLNRVLSILNRLKDDSFNSNEREEIDGISSDIIDSPIDSDKLDYLVRDSINCNAPYGKGIDWQRFLSALTVDVKSITESKIRLTLAYRSKGSPAIESLLLCRYQMYGAVYWHHTYRCILTMFSHAAACTLMINKNDKIKIQNENIEASSIEELLYQRVICGNPVLECEKILKNKGLQFPNCFKEEAPNYISDEKSIEFIWKLAMPEIKNLLDRLARRELYRRVFEIKFGELEKGIDFTTLQNELSPIKKIDLAKRLEKIILDVIHKRMVNRSNTVETITENMSKSRFDELKKKILPLIIIDFPTRGIPEEKNFPTEISDSTRKYISGNIILARNKREIFQTVRSLQIGIASLRVFAAPELHELIIRYMNPEDVYDCIISILPVLKIR